MPAGMSYPRAKPQQSGGLSLLRRSISRPASNSLRDQFANNQVSEACTFSSRSLFYAMK